MNIRRPTALRCLAVALAETALAATGIRVLVAGLRGPVITADEALVRISLLALLACVVWAWLAALSIVGDALAGRPRFRMRGVPFAVRRMLLSACGVAVATALAQSASAADSESRRDPLAGLPMPVRAVGGAHFESSGPVTAPTSSRTVLVGPGDCLWSLAAADLPPDATAAEVDARWRDIYRVNRAVIGGDPDLILPGQLLSLPRLRTT